MSEQRYCPICEQWMVETVCPTDGVGTITEKALAASRDTLSSGLVLAARYRIEHLIGRGGMGRVYRAQQTSIGRAVALKTLNTDFRTDPRMLKRFHREARAAATLEHANIVKIYDFGVDDELGIPFIAMELLEGRPLNQILHEEGPRTEAQACAVLAAVTHALVEAHEKGVIHRDLKPDNIFVRSATKGSDLVKVLDFGIASMRNHEDTPTEKLTRTGVPLGTPHYMSPEQALGRAVDYRSDLYALGCILYELLTGDTLFISEQPLTILMNQVQEPSPSLPSRLVDGSRPSDGVIQLYQALVAKDAQSRPASTSAVADAFQALSGAESLEIGELLDTIDAGWSFGSRIERQPSQESLPTDPTLAHSSDELRGLESNMFPAAGEIRSPQTALGLPAPEQGNNSRIWALAGLSAVCAVVLWVTSISGPGSQPSPGLQPTRAAAGQAHDARRAESPRDASNRETTSTADLSVRVQSIKFTSTPSDVIVTRDGNVLGSTPFTSQFSTDDFPLRVRFNHPRFETLDRDVSLGTDAVSETLTRKSAFKPEKTTGRRARKSVKSNAQRASPSPRGKGKSDSGKLKVPSAW